MNRLFIILLFVPSITIGQTYDTLTLFECYNLAMTSDPVSGQKILLETQNQLKIKNANVNLYPSLDINGSYTWQSEVIELGLMVPVPGVDIPVMPQYNYKLTLDVQQSLYDGGITRSQKVMENTNLLVNQQKVDIELNNLKEKINSIYFYLLVLNQQERMTQLMLDELQKKREVIESGFRNGVLLAMDVDLIDAELLKVKQQLQEILILKSSAVEILKLHTGIEIDQKTVLVIPETELELNSKSQRPEYQLFDLQIDNLDATRKLARSQRNPKLFAFGTFGYGNPGLNYFSDQFHGYYMVGAGLRWKFWDWGKTNRDQQVLAVQQDIIRTDIASFDRNLNIMLEDELARVRKLEELLKTDMEIVILREKITKSAASQLENGVLKSTDYISDLNAETQAKIQLETHRIQLVQSIINYLTKKGNT